MCSFAVILFLKLHFSISCKRTYNLAYRVFFLEFSFLYLKQFETIEKVFVPV